MPQTFIATAFALAFVAPFSAHGGSLDVAGHWYTPDKAAIVKIADCGDGTPCGKVAWVDAQAGMTEDTHNDDEGLRGRSMVGVTLLHGFERSDDSWRAGEIYNPENGKSYRAHIQRVSDDTLAVSGCLGPVCKKLIWERAEAGVSKDAPQGQLGEEASSSL